MNKSWTISAILVLSIAVPGIASFEHGPDGPAQDRDRGFVAGGMLADSLVRNCSIFIGTLYEVESPETEPAGVDERELSYSKVTIKVDEWLRGEPERWGQEISLLDVPVVMSGTYGSEFRGDRWRGVKLAVGGRLVVAFPPGEITRGQPLTVSTGTGWLCRTRAFFRQSGALLAITSCVSGTLMRCWKRLGWLSRTRTWSSPATWFVTYGGPKRGNTGT